MTKDSITKGFAKSINSYSNNASIQKEVSLKLAHLIAENIIIPPSQILEIGCGTGFLTSELLADFPFASFTINDINSTAEVTIRTLFNRSQSANPKFVFQDAELFDFPESYNLIASSSCFQWFDDQADFFKRISSKLKPQGLFAFSSFGPQNMEEIKASTNQGLSYYTLEQYKEILEPYFDIISFSEDVVKLNFETPYDVLKHLKATGVNGNFRQQWTRKDLETFTSNYKQFETERGFSLTYHPIYFICRALC